MNNFHEVEKCMKLLENECDKDDDNLRIQIVITISSVTVLVTLLVIACFIILSILSKKIQKL